MRTNRLKLLIALLTLSVLPAAQGAPAYDDAALLSRTGLIISAERRFDPFVQRLIAKRELVALPIAHSPLFLLVPMGRDPYHEQSQIQFLEHMLRERGNGATEEGNP